MTKTTIQYRKILASDVVKVHGFAFDIFIKLSESKYLKIVTSDSPHFDEELSHYHKKASDYLYVDENAFKKIAELLGDDIETKIDPELNSESESEKEKEIKFKIPPSSNDNFGVHAETYILVHRLMGKLGVKDLELELIDNSLSSFFTLVKKQAELMKRLQRLLDQKDYITNHSLMTLYITSLMLKQMGENHGSIQEKVTTASFFKDITLDNPQQAKIWNKNDPLLGTLPAAEVETILNHPLKAVEVVKKLKNFSADIEAMIRDHHELPDGSGFPKSVNVTTLTSTTAIFNCACFFSQEVLNQGLSQLNPIAIFKKMDDLYSKGTFKPIYLALKGLVLNKYSIE